MRRTHIAVLLSLSLVALTASAQQKPDFTGDWVLDKAKSTLVKQLAGIQKGVVHIEHDDPDFEFDRTFTFDGKDSNFGYELTTDGNEVVSDEDGNKLYSRLYWEGDSLVYFTRIVAPAGEATNVVHYRLANDGRELRAEEQFRGPQLSYDNLWVFDRQ
jgi:hypothetical protein